MAAQIVWILGDLYGNNWIEQTVTDPWFPRAVAAPGFPKGGANPGEGGANILFGIIFALNYENEKNWTKKALLPRTHRSATVD